MKPKQSSQQKKSILRECLREGAHPAMGVTFVYIYPHQLYFSHRFFFAERYVTVGFELAAFELLFALYQNLSQISEM